MDLKGFFNKLGYDISEKENWNKNLDLWQSWYRGKVRKFHNYYIYNGQRKVKREKKSLQGAKKVCEDWADLLFNEKVKINLTNQESTEKLSNIFEDNNAVVTINQGIEKTFALGTGALVVSVEDLTINENDEIVSTNGSKVKLEFVEGRKIYPLSWNNTEITECAFVSYKTIAGKNYAYITIHRLDESKNYVIDNYKYEVRNGTLIEVEDKEGFLGTFKTESNLPWFSILKPNICNNIDEDVPFGLSVYANSIDTLKSLDNSYNELDNEVVLGRRRIFIAEEMMNYDNGLEELTFDPEDISIYRMPKGFNKDSMIQSSSEALRTEDLQKSTQFQLNILSAKVGFGQERYQFDGKSIQTATGVISENSDMYRTIKKHEQVLENSLKTIIKSIAYASSKFTINPIDASEITIDFDDSVIEDKGAEQVRAQQEVVAGLRSKQNYMEEIRGLGKDKAKEELETIQQEKMSNQEAFGIIPNEEEKEE